MKEKYDTQPIADLMEGAIKRLKQLLNSTRHASRKISNLVT